ncbi:MAG: ATP-grasp domain-containing protein [Bacteroidales bacterium]|nr:ATP-grasp domain-containing protein [Bacteroidales bacterium]
MKKIVLILYNKLSKTPKDDEADVIEQVNLVASALQKLKYEVRYLQIDLNLKAAISGIKRIGPDIIFNLAETIGNKGEFTFLANSVLNFVRIPYTGSPLIPMFQCSNKYLARKELKAIGVKTPAGFMLDECHKLLPTGKYIIKPIWEEGSLELDEDCVFMGSDTDFINRIMKKSRQHYFIEEFIDGREFNISILYSADGPEVLPLAEMTFHDYPAGKPKMMGYKSKWDDRSFEYTHTRRTFRLGKEDDHLRKQLTAICKKCWNELGLKGYVRIDFRVTNKSEPLVIDINLNPCLSESGGFMAASKKRGLKFEEVIERVLEDATRKN